MDDCDIIINIVIKNSFNNYSDFTKYKEKKNLYKIA